MALVKASGKIAWDPSTSADVVGYRVFYSLSGEAPTYDSPFVDVGPVTEVALPLPGFPLFEGDVTFGIAAVDAVGNVSDLTPITVPLDEVAPAAPGNVVFIPA